MNLLTITRNAITTVTTNFPERKAGGAKLKQAFFTLPMDIVVSYLNSKGIVDKNGYLVGKNPFDEDGLDPAKLCITLWETSKPGVLIATLDISKRDALLAKFSESKKEVESIIASDGNPTECAKEMVEMARSVDKTISGLKAPYMQFLKGEQSAEDIKVILQVFLEALSNINTIAKEKSARFNKS